MAAALTGTAYRKARNRAVPSVPAVARSFVAAFIGSPAMNLYEASMGEGARSIHLGSQRIDLPESVLTAHPGLAAYASRKVILGLRPKHLHGIGATRGSVLTGDVDLVESLGSELVVHFTIDARRIQAEDTASRDARPRSWPARASPASARRRR